MKNLILIAGFVFIFLQACKESISPPENATPSIGLVTTTGSYWIFQKYIKDSSGSKVVFLDLDSTYICGDSIVNQKKYIHYKIGGNKNNSGQSVLLRDSSGFIVTTDGRSSYNNINHDIFLTPPNDELDINFKMTNFSRLLSLPLGDFRALERVQIVCRKDKKAFNECVQCDTSRSYFVEGIGEIIDESAYFNCETYGKELIRYHIE